MLTQTFLEHMKNDCHPTTACLHPVIGVVPLLTVLHPRTKWLRSGTALL